MRVAVFRIINKFKYNKILQNVHKKEIRKTKDNNQEKILESKKGCWNFSGNSARGSVINKTKLRTSRALLHSILRRLNEKSYVYLYMIDACY